MTNTKKGRRRKTKAGKKDQKTKTWVVVAILKQPHEGHEYNLLELSKFGVFPDNLTS